MHRSMRLALGVLPAIVACVLLSGSARAQEPPAATTTTSFEMPPEPPPAPLLSTPPAVTAPTLPASQSGRPGTRLRLLGAVVDLIDSRSDQVLDTFNLAYTAMAPLWLGTNLYVGHYFTQFFSIIHLPSQKISLREVALDPPWTWSLNARRDRLTLLDHNGKSMVLDVTDADRPIPPHPDPPPSPAPSLDSPNQPQWNGLHRFYFKGRPFYGPVAIGGTAIELGTEHILKGGFKIGFAIESSVSSVFIGGFRGRLELGYARRSFGISVGVGSGFPYTFPHFTPAFRIGSYDGTYVTFRIAWSLAAAPMVAELDIVIRTKERTRLTLNLACGTEPVYSYICGSGHLMAGLQYYLAGTGRRRTSVFTFGAGLVFVLSVIPGPIFSLGYERRF